MFDAKRFRAQAVLKGKTMRDLAAAIGTSESTIYRKINQDGSFTRSEINQLIDVLEIEDPTSIFFADKLA